MNAQASNASTPRDLSSVTPMMRQYFKAKDEHPGALLMFRMGDFFEVFGDDAKLASELLGLTLTARDKGPNAMPMAGVPHHAAEGYIGRLVRMGHTVAVCDQVEDAKHAKGLVRREVTRVISPGTVVDLEGLDPSAPTYLAYVGPEYIDPKSTKLSTKNASDRGLVLALLDLLAGEVLYTFIGKEQLADELHRMRVREVLYDQSFGEMDPLLVGAGGAHGQILADTPPALRFLGEMPPTEEVCEQIWQEHWPDRKKGDASAKMPHPVRCAIVQLVTFAEISQKRSLQHLIQPKMYRLCDHVILDGCTRRNLELEQTWLHRNKNGSLLAWLDKCRTSLGSRLLRQWMLFPLRQKKAIDERLDAVASLLDQEELRQKIRRDLAPVRDIERLAGRVAMGRATPRDLGSLRDSLGQMPHLIKLCLEAGGGLAKAWKSADTAAILHERLRDALADMLPTGHTEGEIFRVGHRDDLDKLIELSTKGHEFLRELEAKERKRTGISSLKVRYNKVFGYYLEVTKSNLGQVPEDYIRKQTLVNAERFITEELKDFEEKILTADEERCAREAELFVQLRAYTAGWVGQLRALARLVAQTDAWVALAEVAKAHGCCRPKMVDGRCLKLVGARHPMVEAQMPPGERFIPGDLTLEGDDRQILVVTGPNMAGKSTVMRQAALCTLLAHMGAFVPAKRATVGICDRIFTRVGASDNLGGGQSTFMVEMVETATILRDATEQSLVLLDEIGRGTSTFDGISLAWAVAEDLHNRVGCLTLFATHYHELAALSEHHDRIHNVSVVAKEIDGRIVFLRKLEDGALGRSYGIHVAKLAGLPDGVLGRACDLLASLEGASPLLEEGNKPTLPASSAVPALSTLAVAQKAPDAQISLFAERKPSAVHTALAELNPMTMTPIEALACLDRLKALAAAEEDSR